MTEAFKKCFGCRGGVRKLGKSFANLLRSNRPACASRSAQRAEDRNSEARNVKNQNGVGVSDQRAQRTWSCPRLSMWTGADWQNCRAPGVWAIDERKVSTSSIHHHRFSEESAAYFGMGSAKREVGSNFSPVARGQPRRHPYSSRLSPDKPELQPVRRIPARGPRSSRSRPIPAAKSGSDFRPESHNKIFTTSVSSADRARRPPDGEESGTTVVKNEGTRAVLLQLDS
jgi:hypothetical protein